MKITKRQLRKIVKEATLNEFFGGKKKKAKQGAALDELQKAALEYISNFQSSKVGPFLDKNDDPLSSTLVAADGRELQRKIITPAYQHRKVAHGPRLDDEAHEEMKDHVKELERMIKAWEQATGERADNDNATSDARAVSTAVAIPSLYLRGNPDSANEGKKMKITEQQLRRIIREAVELNEKGLWDNVHAKRKRGEKPAKKGDKDYPDEKSWKAAQEDDNVEGDPLEEAEYQGRDVKVNKPTAIRKGDTGYGKKQKKVYVKDGPKEDDVKVVRFGDPDSRIRKSNPKAKKSFDARHNCDNPGPKTKARYWSCKEW